MELGDLAVGDFLFSESNGRLLLEVQPEDAIQVEALFATQTLLHLGMVTTAPVLRIEQAEEPIIDLSIEQLIQAWKGSNP